MSYATYGTKKLYCCFEVQRVVSQAIGTQVIPVIAEVWGSQFVIARR